MPVVAEVSGLRFNRDFFAGYSPERANPGDPTHRLAKIVKVTAGSTPETAEFVDALYASLFEDKVKRLDLHDMPLTHNGTVAGDPKAPGPALLNVVTARYELVMPPKTELAAAFGMALYSTRAILSGQGGQVLQMMEENFLP